MHYNRKQRRHLAKQIGLLDTSNESYEKSAERRTRSIQAGKQIQAQFLAENEVRQREAAAESEARQAANLAASLGAEEAARIIENNKKLQKQRAEKLAKRKGA